MHEGDIKGATDIADRFSLLSNPGAKEHAYVVSTFFQRLCRHRMLYGMTRHGDQLP